MLFQASILANNGEKSENPGDAKCKT